MEVEGEGEGEVEGGGEGEVDCTSSTIMILSTVQLRGKLTLASESLASATAYTRECDGLHSRVRARSLAHFRRVLASAPPLARVLLASARPLARLFYSRVLDRSLACVLVASAGSSPAQRAPR